MGEDAPLVGVDALMANKVALASECLATGLEVAGEGTVTSRLVGVDEVSDVHGEAEWGEKEGWRRKERVSSWAEESVEKLSGLEEGEKRKLREEVETGALTYRKARWSGVNRPCRPFVEKADAVGGVDEVVSGESRDS
jgi:hypothetical protein